MKSTNRHCWYSTYNLLYKSIIYQSIHIFSTGNFPEKQNITFEIFSEEYDVDLETGKVVINKTTQYIDKHIYEKKLNPLIVIESILLILTLLSF